VLDGNVLAGDSPYFRVGDAETSPDQQRLAYSVDFNGSERYELRVRDLATGADVDTVPNVYYGVAWGDDTTVFYTRTDDAMRPYQVWRHTVGAPAADDELVWEDDDERFDVWIYRSRSDAFVIFGSESRTTSEVWLVPTAEPRSAPRVVAARRDGVEYHVDHRGDDLLIWTNDEGATNFAAYAARLDDLARERWRVLVPHDPDVRLSQVVAFAGFTILYERTNGLERLRVLEADMTVDLPDPVYSVWPGANREFDTPVFRYEYSSLVQPRSAYDFDVAAGTSTLVRRQPVPGYEPERYVAAREWATAADGTRVPISLVRRRDTPLDASAPLLLYGYGAYEYSIDPVFDVDVLPLLDRGWVYAIAHPRGGGELGRPWYDDGHLRNKINTFTDFIACADQLVDAGLVDGDRVAARGASAGGLLMGGVTVLAPERWWKIVAEVPFVDVLSTMSDASIPLTVNEWEEWGNPADAGDYAAMRAYSPYDNILAGVRYPAMLVTGGLNDPRVQYWEPAKFVAKLRAVSPHTPVLLKMEMGAGHGGPSGRYDAWRDEAFVLAFLLDET
jgi:oligopeptidase B